MAVFFSPNRESSQRVRVASDPLHKATYTTEFALKNI